MDDTADTAQIVIRRRARVQKNYRWRFPQIPSARIGMVSTTNGTSLLLADRTHDARSGAAVACGALHLLHDRLVVRGNRRDSEFRLHEHDLVAVGLEIVQ